MLRSAEIVFAGGSRRIPLDNPRLEKLRICVCNDTGESKVPFSIAADYSLASTLCADRHRPCGMDADLWELLAAELLKESEWDWVKKPMDKLPEATASGSCAVSMCAIRATQKLGMNRQLHMSRPYS